MLGTGRKWYALVTVLLGPGALMGGCGGDSSEPIASIPSAPTTTAPKIADGKAQSRSDSNSKSPSRSAKERTVPNKARSGRERAITKAVGNLPPSKRARIVKQVARAVFVRYGFSSGKFAVPRTGTSVRATLGTQEACTATPTTEGSLARTVSSAIPWLRSVRIVVSGSGKSLSDYVQGSCRPVTLPGGSGPIRLTKRGSTLAETTSFKIDSKRWTVEYINGGRFLQVLVIKDGRPTGTSFEVTKRGPGRRVLSGPGKFSMQIGGTGEWVVRVRDGG